MTLFLVGLFAGVCFAVLEWRRPVPLPLLRAMLALLAATALGGLAGAPSRRVAARTDRILVTPNAAATEIDSAKRMLPGAVVLEMTDSLTPTALLHAVGSGHLLIVGDGPPAAWWPILAPASPSIIAPRASLPRGFASITASARIALGEAWMLNGRLGGTQTDNRRIVGIGPDEQRDSAQSDSTGRFSLAVRPRAAGSWSWTLIAESDSAVIGVDVAPRRVRRVLLLAGSPSFELTALKRRLAERGDEVIVRVRSSAERVVTEYVNLPTGPAVPRMDNAQWRDADHVVVLGTMRSALSEAESATLQRAVRDGLGLIRVIGDPRDNGDATGDAVFALPGLQAVSAADEQTGERNARVRGLVNSAPVPVAAARFTSGSILLQDDAARGLAAQRNLGEGRIVGTLITDAARWRTLGDTITFDGYWRTLFDATRRPERSTSWQPDGDSRLGVGQLRTVSRLTAAPDSADSLVRIIAPSGQEDTVRTIVGADDPARRVLALRPREAGWHRIAALADTDSSVSLLVQNGSADKAQTAYAARDAALRRSAPFAAELAAEGSITSQQPWLPAWGWLLIATLAAGTLWLLQRRDG